ncbi:preprotein translocase subunit SecY [Pseudoleptotrichia goodfellowii]|uniref:Protein translocase subunit SecY n=2 Tax=Pseudoleptotrichia goodfellowii TaxID=157692 RepID=D0GL51_9FUSO|nr:preprotein translocase subunit SecY [Pseudoleptotrichia goodfellowii]EEY35157.1 preprotein translocase, SecY subunit [Pseudoleptotrichia goodfellowii F0264]BBM37209.1 preprotein translocase subunit SecY [Pseudoleptotrichia goodfellowii]
MTLTEAIVNRIQSIFKIPELKKRVAFTLVMFAIARIGVHIAVPGINMAAFKNFQNNAIAGFLNLFSGGAVQRASIFSLGIIPYINSSIVFQLLGVIFPKIDEMQKEGGKERDKITQWTRYVTIILAIAQSFGIAITLINQPGLVVEPGPKFIISTMALMTGGTAFLMWISERISIRGIGNGSSMLIFLGIVVNLPQVIQQMVSSNINFIFFGLSIILFVVIIALMVDIQLAERRIPIQYAGKGSLGFGGGQSAVGRRTYLPLKINTAGVMPIIFASVLMAAPPFIVQMLKANAFWQKQFSQTGVLYLLLFAFLIIVFSFFYTLTIAFDPEKVSEDLKQSGGTIPTVRAGKETADYLEKVVTRVTFGSALFLAILGIFPNIWFGYFLHIPVLLGGTSLLILVGVAVELIQQIDSYLAVKKMKGFISTSGKNNR